MPGQFIPGADSHSRAYGAYGAVGIGVGSTTLGFGWATGYVYFTLAEGAARRVRRPAAAVGRAARTSSSSCCGAGAPKQSQGMSVELVDANRQLPIAYRNTIANMMAEAEAQNGIFAPDDITARVVSREGDRPSCRIRRSRRAPTPSTRSTRRSISPTCVPMIAKPFSPGNAFPAEEVARERLTFDKAMIGSCTNGSYDDLLHGGARRPRRARAGASTRGDASSSSSRARAASAGRSSGPIRASAASRSPRCSDRSAARSASRGAVPASARARTRCEPGQRAITSFNRNWQNRMGVGGEGYLASPAVVAASALLGYMAPPERARV